MCRLLTSWRIGDDMPQRIDVFWTAGHCGRDDISRLLVPLQSRELSIPKGTDRADRYIGYIAETMETMYFLYQKNRLNITHAGCIFLV